MKWQLTNTVSKGGVSGGNYAEVDLRWLPFISWKPSRQVHTTIKLFLCNSKPTMAANKMF